MELKERFGKSGLTLKEIAAKLGKSVSTVSDVINGNYSTANAELYKAAIEKIINEKISEVKDERFLTLSQEKILDRIKRMRQSGLSFFELVVGGSGMGKTHLMKIVEKEMGAVYVKARVSQSASAFMSMLLKAIGEKVYGNTDEKLERFCEAFEASGKKILIVDEADLFARDKDATFERKFELLREIYEYGKTNGLSFIVIAVGLDILKKRIDRLGGYLQSRITYSPEMKMNEEELLKVAEMMGLGSVSEYLVSGMNARLFEKAANNVALGYEERVSANLVYSVRK